MNRRTNQNQRKIRIPSVLKIRPKKVVVAKETPDASAEVDASCQTRGCGCGNWFDLSILEGSHSIL